MKTMIFTDLLTTKNSLLQLLAIDVILGVFMMFALGTFAGGLACMVVVLPFMFLFSVAAYDGMEGWERFRLTLPLTRTQVVCGRYASVLIVLLLAALLGLTVAHFVVALVGLLPDRPYFIPPTGSTEGLIDAIVAVVASMVIVLFAGAITLPLALRFGMTKAIRFVPLVVIGVLCAGIALSGSDGVSGLLNEFGSQFASQGDMAIAALICIAWVVALALYLISAFIATKLYAHREL